MEAARNVTLMLKRKRLGFPDLARARSINGGAPGFGGRIIIDPKDPDVAVIEEAMNAVAAFAFGKSAESALKVIVNKGRSAFSREEYANKKGEVYSGFEGMYSLGFSAPEFDKNGESRKPLLLDKYGVELPENKQASTLYAGCYCHFKVELFVLLRDDGNRISCQIKGVMFADDGEPFGGTSTPTTAEDFAGLAAPAPDADDFF